MPSRSLPIFIGQPVHVLFYIYVNCVVRVTKCKRKCKVYTFFTPCFRDILFGINRFVSDSVFLNSFIEKISLILF